jgi:hypothetical protein
MGGAQISTRNVHRFARGDVVEEVGDERGVSFVSELVERPHGIRQRLHDLLHGAGAHRAIGRVAGRVVDRQRPMHEERCGDDLALLIARWRSGIAGPEGARGARVLRGLVHLGGVRDEVGLLEPTGGVGILAETGKRPRSVAGVGLDIGPHGVEVPADRGVAAHAARRATDVAERLETRAVRSLRRVVRHHASQEHVEAVRRVAAFEQLEPDALGLLQLAVDPRTLRRTRSWAAR